MFPDDPMVPARYPNGQFKTICHDCYAFVPSKLPKPPQLSQEPLSSNGFQQVKAQLNFLQNKLNDHIDRSKKRGEDAEF